MNLNTTTITLPDLGTFEGFNFRDQCAIERVLTAEEVVHWEHDTDGEAEFWPSGEDPLVKAIFRGNVTGSELVSLAELLTQMDGDRDENLLRIQFACQIQGECLQALTPERMDDIRPMIFYGDSVFEVRKIAGFELFETFWPELFKIWDNSAPDFLRFEWDELIDSPNWTTLEVNLGKQVVLLVALN